MMQHIVSSIIENDVISPIKSVMADRRKLKRATTNNAPVCSIYRDILFLSFVALGRSNIDTNSFDKEYRSAFSYMNPRDLQKLKRFDHPPKINTVSCRRVFEELEL